jgi:hypothetical protein
MFEATDLEAFVFNRGHVYYHINAIWQTPDSTTLEAYMIGLHDSLAGDPQDKVYSELGMLSDTKRQQCDIIPSYASSNTMADVYCAATKAIVTVYDNVDILRAANGADADAEAAGLPCVIPFS